MTLTVQIPAIEYLGDGIQTIFTYSFTVDMGSEMVVSVDDQQQVEYSDFTIENQNEFGGEIHFTLPPADQSTVLIRRRTPLEQMVALEPFTEFPAPTIEWSLDRIIRIIQEKHSGVEDGTGGTHPVMSVFSRLGHILGEAGDYTAALIDYVNAFSGLNATDVQAAIDELHSNAGDHLTDTDNPHEVTHLQLPDRGEDDHHPKLHAGSHAEGEEDALPHDSLPGTGINTHDDIDVHIADETIHGRYYEQEATPSAAVSGSWWFNPSDTPPAPEYDPAMMHFDGTTGYYNLDTSAIGGNKQTCVVRVQLAAFTGDRFWRVLRLEDTGNNSRLSLQIYSSDYSAQVERQNKCIFYVSDGSGVGVCSMLSLGDLADGQEHIIFAAYDGDTGEATYFIDSSNADDLTFPSRIAPVTGTLGIVDQYGVGANYSGANKAVAALGYHGLDDKYLVNWLDFMDGSKPKEIDTSGWAEWNGQPLAWSEFGQMDNNIGTGSDMTAHGTITGPS